MINREAKNSRCFDDPAGLFPFFKDGKVVVSLAIVPLNSIDVTRLTEAEYRSLVRKFQLSFCDFGDVFPEMFGSDLGS